jgi:hypothetical protein
MAIKFVVCLEKHDLGEFSSDDVAVGKLYELIDAHAGNGMVRIIDESGEDYLYPDDWFEPVALDESTAHRLHDALARRMA